MHPNSIFIYISYKLQGRVQNGYYKNFARSNAKDYGQTKGTQTLSRYGARASPQHLFFVFLTILSGHSFYTNIPISTATLALSPS